MRDFPGNIIAGARLALLLPVTADAFRYSWGQVWLLAGAGLLLSMGLDWSFTDAPRAFNGYGFHDEAVFLVLVLFSAWISARPLGRPEFSLALPLIWLAAALTAYPLQALIVRGWPDPGLDFRVSYGIGIGWWILIVYRSLVILGIGSMLHRLYRAVVVLLIVTLPDWHFTPVGFWYHLPDRSDATSAPPPLDAEAILFSQQSKLDAALDQLAVERPGETDLYTIGFAGHGSEDVFLREIALLENLGASRFGEAFRHLKLINNRATVNQVPLATRSNLQYALERITEHMNVEEDVLFLFLTSHGSRDHSLSVELANLPLEPLDSPELSEMLEAIPVRWKVIVVSACYAGGFLPSLADAQTLVITAAHAERQSFGCSNESELTWFGRAFLRQGLSEGLGFVDAFRRAGELVSEWETQENYEQSLPQIAAGSEIVRKLEKLGW